MYFFEDEYFISAKNHPYIEKDGILDHNLHVKRAKKMSKKITEIESSIEESNTLIAQAIGLAMALIFLFYYITNN